MILTKMPIPILGFILTTTSFGLVVDDGQLNITNNNNEYVDVVQYVDRMASASRIDSKKHKTFHYKHTFKVSMTLEAHTTPSQKTEMTISPIPISGSWGIKCSGGGTLYIKTTTPSIITFHGGNCKIIDEDSYNFSLNFVVD